MGDNKEVFGRFIAEQLALITNGSGVKAPKAHKMIVEPEKEIEEEMDEFAYIITKKPAKKRVSKYIQGLIDAIVAENED